MLRHKHIPGCSGAKSRHVCHRPVQSRTRGAVEYSVKHCARKREFHDNGYRLRIRGRFASHLERRRSDHQLHQRNSAPRLRTRQSCGVVGHGHHHRHQPRAGRRKVRLPHLHHQPVRDSTVGRCTNPTQHRSLGGIFISTPRYIPRPPRWKQQCPATTTRSCHSEPARSGGESLP